MKYIYPPPRPKFPPRRRISVDEWLRTLPPSESYRIPRDAKQG